MDGSGMMADDLGVGLEWLESVELLKALVFALLLVRSVIELTASWRVCRIDSLPIIFCLTRAQFLSTRGRVGADLSEVLGCSTVGVGVEGLAGMDCP